MVDAARSPRSHPYLGFFLGMAAYAATIALTMPPISCMNDPFSTCDANVPLAIGTGVGVFLVLTLWPGVRRFVHRMTR